MHACTLSLFSLFTNSMQLCVSACTPTNMYVFDTLIICMQNMRKTFLLLQIHLLLYIWPAANVLLKQSSSFYIIWDPLRQRSSGVEQLLYNICLLTQRNICAGPHQAEHSLHNTGPLQRKSSEKEKRTMEGLTSPSPIYQLCCFLIVLICSLLVYK